MKKFISMLLVAMLLVGCLSTVAFAAGEDRYATVSFTVSGEFMNLTGTVTAESPLVITAIGGVTGNPANGVFKWADAVNANQNVTVTVTVKLPAGASCGSYSVSYSGTHKIGVFDENGSLDHTEVNGSFSGSATASFDHSWGEWVETPGDDCQHKGTKTRTCSICGTVQTEEGLVGAHNWSTKWSKDANEHWHECTNEGCNAVNDQAEHSWSGWEETDETDADGNVMHKKHCNVCWREAFKWLPPEVQPWGDATPYGAYNAVLFIAVAFTLCCATGMIFKRKFAK